MCSDMGWSRSAILIMKLEISDHKKMLEVYLNKRQAINDKMTTPPKHCHGKKWSITKKKAKTIGKRLKIITGNNASWCSYLSKPSLWQSNSDDWMKVCVHSNTHIIAKTFKACNKIMYYKILFISLLLQPFCMSYKR